MLLADGAGVGLLASVQALGRDLAEGLAAAAALKGRVQLLVLDQVRSSG